jgi:hypothetical protein
MFENLQKSYRRLRQSCITDRLRGMTEFKSLERHVTERLEIFVARPAEPAHHYPLVVAADDEWYQGKVHHPAPEAQKDPPAASHIHKPSERSPGSSLDSCILRQFWWEAKKTFKKWRFNAKGESMQPVRRIPEDPYKVPSGRCRFQDFCHCQSSAVNTCNIRVWSTPLIGKLTT